MSFDDARQKFLVGKDAAGCAPATLDWYKFNLKHYATWLAESGHTYNTVTLTDLHDFLASMRKSYSPSTVRQMAAVLISFYRWCMMADLITDDPTVKLKRPAVPDEIQPVAARSYVEHLLNTIKPQVWLDARDKLIIQILFCTGLRCGECAGLRVQDVDFEHRRLAILGKGGKVRYQPFPEELLEPLRAWLERWRPGVDDSDALFFSGTTGGRVRGPITVQAVYDTLRRRAEYAAMDWIPPHGYRRGFATDMLLNGASTRLVQALLGHASVTTTERYLRLSPDQVQAEYEKFWEELEPKPAATKPAARQPKERPPAEPAAAEPATTFTFWTSES